MTKTAWVREGFIWLTFSNHEGNSSKGGTETETNGGMLLPVLFPQLAQFAFLNNPRPTTQGWHSLQLGWVLPDMSLIRKMHHGLATGQSEGSIFWLQFALRSWSNWYQADRKANLHSTLCSVGRRTGVFPLLLILMAPCARACRAGFFSLLLILMALYGLVRVWNSVRHHLFYTQHCSLTFRKVAIPTVYENTLNAESFYFHAQL